MGFNLAVGIQLSFSELFETFHLHPAAFRFSVLWFHHESHESLMNGFLGDFLIISLFNRNFPESCRLNVAKLFPWLVFSAFKRMRQRFSPKFGLRIPDSDSELFCSNVQKNSAGEPTAPEAGLRKIF